MLSRVASSIYWMNRYIERAESLARFVDVTLSVQLDTPGDARAQWAPLISATGDHELFLERYSEFSQETVQQFITFDREYASSILSSLSAARENARTVREAISSEAWEILNEFYLAVKHAASNRSASRDIEFYSQVKRYGHLFEGVLQSTMSRDKGWYFGNLGKYLERADKTSRILDVKYFTLLPSASDVDTTIDDLLWSAVLRSVDAFEMYRKRYHSLTLPRIIEFLVLDTEFPRSIHFSVRMAAQALKRVGDPDRTEGDFVSKLVDELQDRLTTTDAVTIIRNGLHEFIDSLQQDLNKVGDAIQGAYFARRQPEPKT